MATTPSYSALLDIKEVMKRVGMSKSAIYYAINDGWFPRQVKRGRSSRWFEAEIDAVLEKLNMIREEGGDYSSLSRRRSSR